MVQAGFVCLRKVKRVVLVTFSVGTKLAHTVRQHSTYNNTYTLFGEQNSW
jgi:hypothetical protein